MGRRGVREGEARGERGDKHGRRGERRSALYCSTEGSSERDVHAVIEKTRRGEGEEAERAGSGGRVAILESAPEVEGG